MNNTLKVNIIFIFFIFSSYYSQSKTIIEYNYDFANMHNLKSYIIADQNESYFFFSKDGNIDYNKLIENDFLGLNTYHIYNFQYDSQKIYQRVFMVPDKKQKTASNANETLKNLDWKISTSSKQILTYKAYLATTNFRGREYKVWFTKDLPYEIFPWKLKGLPGVILEFEDKEGFIKGVATKITLNSDKKFNDKYTSFFIDKKASMPFKNLISLENGVLKNEMNRSIASLPKGTEYEIPNLRDMSLEKSFEWEKKARSKKP